MSDPYRGQYDQQARPARRGREDEGQYTTRQSRYPQPTREYDSPRSPVHSRDQGPMSPRGAKAHQDPTLGEDEDNETDDELAAQIAELMKMRKEKAKAKASQRSMDQASQVSDMDRRSRYEGSHRGYEDSPMGRQSQGRRGDGFHMSPREKGSGDRHHLRDQDIYVPPAARPPESVRSERSNQAIGMGRPSRTVNDNRLDPVNSQNFVPRGREAAAPVRNDSYKYYQGQRISSNVFSPGYGFRPSAPRNDTLPDPEELVGPYGAVHRIYPAPCPVAPPINANDGWVDEVPAADTRSFSSVATASDHPAPSVSYRQQQDRPMSPPPSDHASVPAAQEEEDQWGSKERDHPPHLRERERIGSPRDAQAAAAPTKGSMVPWTDGGVQYSKEHFVETASEEPPPPPSQGSMVPFEGGVVYKQENLNQEGASMTMDELLACFANSRRQPSYAPPKDAYGGGPRGGGGGYMPPRQPDSGWNRSAPAGERQGWGSRGDQGKDDGFGETQGKDEWGPSASGKDTNTGSWGGGGGDNGYGGYGGGGGGGGRNCYNCGEDGHMSRECPEPRKAGGGGGGGGNCFNCNKPGHLSRECPEPRNPVFRGTCRGCGKEGHRQSECPDGGSGGGYGDSYNTGGGDGWGDRNGNGNNGSWEDNNTNGNQNGKDDQWGDDSGFDDPSRARPAANIHPSRAALVNTSTYGNTNNATAQGRDADRPPRDGRARDNGYGGRGDGGYNRAATPAEVSRDPTPIPSNDVDDDHGGW